MSLNLYKCNYIAELEEEIALEGLDGITIDALWVRLLDRPSCSIRPTTDQTKSFLWEAVIRMENLKFYLLPAPRPPIFIFNRQELVDASGHFLEPVIPANSYAYPHYAIESPSGEMGSCPCYSQRKDISSKVVKTNLDRASSKWGSRLVIVADQKTRMMVLSEPGYNLQSEMNVKQYCFLERVGRSRQHGEVTQGKTGLQNITEDSKTLFYYKKSLCRKKLIKQQFFYLKTADASRTGLIIHLPRYSTYIKPKNISDSEKVADFIRTEGSNNVILHKSVMNKFAEHVDVKKLIMRESKRFRTELVPYRAMFPDAAPTEYKMKNGLGEKSVRIVRLLEEPNEDEDGDEDGEGGDGFLNFEFRTLGLSYIRQAYHIIEAAGPRGVRQTDLSRILGLTGLHARGLLKHLTKKGHICTASVDKGRQRAIHYYSKKFEKSKQTLSAELELEMNKLMKMVAPSNTDGPPAKKLKVEREIGSEFFKNRHLMKEVPELSRPSQEEMDAVDIKIGMSDVRTPSSNFNSLFATFGEGTNSVTPDKAQSANITARMVKRAHRILKAVNTHKVIHDPQKLQRMINEEEAAEGHKHTVDRKTITRILDKLVNDGYVRIIKVKLSGYGKEKTLHFIVHPSVDSENSEIRSAIEQAKMKLPIITRELLKKEEKIQRKSLGYSTPLKSFNLGKYDSRAGRKYGLKPKFVKKQVLHSFMFYLVYEHKGKEAAADEIKTLLKNKNVDLSLMDEMSPVYSTSGDWKTFLPPLPQHKDYPKGWCLVSDLLLRLPLVLFVAMVNTPYEIPGLQDYLNHPIKKYYLVRNLPSPVANSLTLHRKYIFTITELITKLAFMGLIQIGPQTLKEKDQYFVYVNRHAMLLDTTPSLSGYNHVSKDMSYETMTYSLKSLPDVEQYWYDLWNFAMNTNLGCRNVMSGKPVVIESVITKKILVDATKPRGVEEAKKLDVGYLPGDRLGAAGLDSDLFVHLKRNWYWTADNRLPAQNSKVLEPRKPSAKRIPSRKRELSKNADTPSGVIKKIKLVAPANQKKQRAKESGETTNDVLETEPEIAQAVTAEGSNVAYPESRIDREKVELEPSDRAVPASRAKHKKITRYLKPKENKTIRKPYYDQIDREALRRMVKLRVDWSSTEDNLLLICKVASLYMSAGTRRHVAKNFAVVREILHSTCPLLSQNKTSRACQRRMCYMMKNPSTAHSVYLCLEEIKQDPEITDKFGMAVEKMDRLVKSQGKGPKCCQAEYDKIYTDLVLCLLGKLKTITTPEEATLENVSIPDSLEEFAKRYSIVVPKNLNLRYGSYCEVQNIVDIMCSVVNVIIHSSLCCSNDKTSYSYQLFFVYQQYPDKLLRSVMARCRSMQIVSCRKRYKRWKTANSGCLPLSSSPYQLSITYINILQTRYQYSIFHESRTSLNSLFSKIAYQQQAASVLPSSSLQSDATSLADVQVTSGGECANIVELFSSGLLSIDVQFPHHLIVLDPRLSEKEESYTLIMKRFKEMLSVINTTNKSREEPDEEVDEDEEPNKTPAVDDMALNSDFNLSNKSGVANTASRLALYMMRDEPVEYLNKGVQHAHDYFVLKPLKIKVKLDEETIKESVMYDETKANIINDVKRQAIFPDETTENDEIMEKLKGECAETVMKSVLEFIETKKELGALYRDILANAEGTVEDIVSCLDLLISEQFVLKSGNVSVRFIHNKFRKPWLVRSYFIPRQQRENMGAGASGAYAIQLRGESDEDNGAASPKAGEEVEKMDTAEAADADQPKGSGEGEGAEKAGKPSEPVVMVLRHKKRRWASLKESKFGKFDFSAMEPVLVNMRPWIRVDGTLNRKVLDRLLGSVLGHCLGTPGILLKTLQNRFTPALQPVHTYDLVLVLHKIKAVELVVLKKPVKPSLFSKRQTVTEVPADGYEDADLVSIHPQLLAVTRFGQFLNERTLKTDYLDALTDFKLLSHSGS